MGRVRSANPCRGVARERRAEAAGDPEITTGSEALASGGACGYLVRLLPIQGAATPMASNDIVTLQDGTFEQEVLKSDVPVLVDFWAVWCGPCKAIAPTVEELARQYKGKVKVAKMDVDEHQNVPQQYGIRSIPTLLMFKGGRVVDTIVGAVPRAKLEDAFKKALG
jgi:thioredoxin 1